jgi:MFS family permease
VCVELCNNLILPCNLAITYTDTHTAVHQLISSSIVVGIIMIKLMKKKKMMIFTGYSATLLLVLLLPLILPVLIPNNHTVVVIHAFKRNAVSSSIRTVTTSSTSSSHHHQQQTRRDAIAPIPSSSTSSTGTRTPVPVPVPIVVASSSARLPYYANGTNVQQALTYIQCFTFLIMMSSSMVALVPVQATLQLFRNDQGRTTQYLSFLTTIAATMELTCSQSIGALLDRRGRKGVLLAIIGVVVVLHTTTAMIQPMNGVTIALQKCIGTIAIGFFMITIQTIITDLVLLSSSETSQALMVSKSINTSTGSHHHNDNNRSGSNGKLNLSSIMAQQMAVTGIGFLFGIMTAGVLSKYISNHYNVIIYSIAAMFTVLAYVLVLIQLHETYDIRSYHAVVVDPLSSTSSQKTWSESIKSIAMKVFNSLLSCTHLLTKYGIKIRILSILLLIMTLPMYMGDLFQIYAKTEWNLSTSMFSTYLSLFAITGIISNVVGSMLIKSMGIRTFTQIAILSKMIPSLFTILFGYRGSMIGIIIGFLGNAQSIGIIAALISQSTTMTTATTTNTATSNTASRIHANGQQQQQQQSSPSRLPSPSQGVMAGERASLMALLKVIGPILYSTLYIQGRNHFQTSNVPFIFNILLSIIALLITSHYL